MAGEKDKPKTFNERMRDGIISHQVGLANYSGHVRNEIWALLDATEADLKEQIKRLDAAGFDTPGRVRRLNSVLEALRAIRGKAWAEAYKVWQTEMNALAKAEPEFVERLMGASAPGIELGAEMPRASDLRDIVRSKPFDGRTLKQWATKIAVEDIGRIETQVKVGLTQGETTTQIAKRIVGSAKNAGGDGVTQITRRQAAATVRTVVSGVSADARQQFMELNKNVAPQKEFVATLDSGTTAICRSLDGNIYDVDDPSAPVLPLHFGERSGYVPVFDGRVVGERPRRSFTNKQLLREFSEKEELDSVPTSRAKLPRGYKTKFDEWSNGRIGELTGTVPDTVNYAEFLGGLSAAQQDDILGKTVGRLYRDGGLTLKQLVDASTGKQRTLADLASRYADAFHAANLDPDKF